MCSFVPFVVGNGLFALLPVYAVHLNADPASIGNYLALAFLAVTIGTIGAGWLSNKFQKRKAFIIGASIGSFVTTALMSQVTQFWQLIPLTVGTWFFVGIILSMTTILAGMFSDESERGRVFGIIGLAGGLGALIGGALSGVIVDKWGYSALFILSGLFMLAVPCAALFLEDQKQIISTQTPAAAPKAPLGRTFYFMFLAAIFAQVPTFIAALGRPLLMDKMHFDPAEISGVVAVGGLVTLPVPFIIGSLSDRFGRFRLIAVSYVMAGVSMVILVGATALWQFWLTAILFSITGSANIVGYALVGDLVAPAALSTGLARYGATGWIGAIFGLTGAGYALQLIGTLATFTIGIILPLIALGLVALAYAARIKIASAPGGARIAVGHPQND